MSEAIAKKYGFEFLTGDVDFVEHGGMFLFEKTGTCGIWDDAKEEDVEHKLYYVLEFMNLEDACGSECEDQLLVSSYLVAPGAVADKEIDSALSSYGYDRDDLNGEGELRFSEKWTRDHFLVELVAGYGCKACASFEEVYSLEAVSEDESLLDSIFEAAAKSAIPDLGLCGFVLDKAQNRIGSTGWDFIMGNPLGGLGL